MGIGLEIDCASFKAVYSRGAGQSTKVSKLLHLGERAAWLHVDLLGRDIKKALFT